MTIEGGIGTGSGSEIGDVGEMGLEVVVVGVSGPELDEEGERREIGTRVWIVPSVSIFTRNVDEAFKNLSM